MKIDTKCVQEGYKPKNGEPRVLPIYQSTTYKYDSTEEVGKLFDLQTPGHMYSRISNPTVECLEKKIASLEGGVAAVCTSSGQAASLTAMLTILKAGDSFISTPTIYGGTVNLFAVTLKRMGIECIFVDEDADEAEIESKIQSNTKAFFGETIANPALAIFDIEKFAKIAHKHSIPLIVDNTFATPILCRPFEFGADIVVHSTTKYFDGHAQTIGGVIVDSGNFDWTNGRFPEMTEPDESYHGVIYTKQFGKEAFASKARVQMVRDMGNCQSAFGAYIINLGMETLALRMQRHCDNALKVAKYLKVNGKIEYVNYPGLEDDKYYTLAMKYCPKGTSGVVSFGIKGGREMAAKFMDSLKLAAIVVHVADARTSVLHPASSTHRQLTDEQLVAAGVKPNLIRMSVGIEDAEDIIADIEQALMKI